MWHHEPSPDDWDAVASDPAFLVWLRARLESHEPIRQVEPTRVRHHLVDWFMESAAHFVAWYPERFYRGADRDNGAWGIREQAVDANVKHGLVSAWARYDAEQREHDRNEFATLDDWLAADVAGTLKAPGAKGGSAKLPHVARMRLHSKAFARRERWPLPCANCGTSFRPTKRGMKYCSACRTPKARKGRVNRDAIMAAVARRRDDLDQTQQPTMLTTRVQQALAAGEARAWELTCEAMERQLADPTLSPADRARLQGRLDQWRLYAQGRRDERDRPPERS